MTDAFRRTCQEQHPEGSVIHRDLSADPVAHIRADAHTAGFAEPVTHTPEQAVAFAWRVQPTEEPEAPDAVLTGAQMYDYTVPSTLKAWLDHVILFGRTAGENPSARETPVTVVASRGGSYAPGTPGEDDEHAQNCLGLILAGTLGLDVDFIVPGLTMAPHNPAMAELVPLFGASRERALQEARGKAKALAERLAAQPAGDRSDVRVPADSHGDGTRTAFAVLPALSRGRRAGAGSFRSSRRRRRSSCPSCRS